MVKFIVLNMGDRVRCIFKQSPFYGRVGEVVGYECDGWIRVTWDGDEQTRICHPNDIEIVEEDQHE